MQMLARNIQHLLFTAIFRLLEYDQRLAQYQSISFGGSFRCENGASDAVKLFKGALWSLYSDSSSARQSGEWGCIISAVPNMSNPYIRLWYFSLLSEPADRFTKR